MIAYEELEKALHRWKTRRAGAAAVSEVPPEISEHGIPRGISGDETSASDSTGELEMGDASAADES